MKFRVMSRYVDAVDARSLLLDPRDFDCRFFDQIGVRKSGAEQISEDVPSDAGALEAILNN